MPIATMRTIGGGKMGANSKAKETSRSPIIEIVKDPAKEIAPANDHMPIICGSCVLPSEFSAVCLAHQQPLRP